jgi:large subunit ribosomal protein L3
MSLGLIGRKVGMMRVFLESGESLPVTVVDVSSNRVAQLKNLETDGYVAVQVACGSRKASRVKKSQAGHFAKASIEAAAGLVEFRVAQDVLGGLSVGAEIKADLFEPGQKVDVQGMSIGKGFSGAIKRHNFSSQRASHGNSISHNAPGSIGMAQDPGRVFPGKKMAGQYGNVKKTVQNLELVRVDVERGLLMIKGAVPGHKGGQIVVKPAVKAKA